MLKGFGQRLWSPLMLHTQFIQEKRYLPARTCDDNFHLLHLGRHGQFIHVTGHVDFDRFELGVWYQIVS